MFDLTTDEDTKRTSYVCRNCHASAPAAGLAQPALHAKMKAHLAEQHALRNVDEWKVTQQQRGEGAAAVCFWPPEAI